MTTKTFRPDRATYVRAHAWMAAIGMAGAMVVLWLIGSPHIWTGALAGLAAIGLRGWYLASEELAAEWAIDGNALTGPGDQRVPLSSIAQVRTMGGYVQVITESGSKYLIKYQSDPAATKSSIEGARQ
ncbi:hypothetical protein [Thalassococcus sp. S3]|uniref:hypothetical protein n=1 Tax=Thalassococcus sp. S3 TaxID=2017482 RepID=UPI001024688F|nr:hypothetical protein [Thalassococcus sp. S3]QBF33554.1 hypothetical protein CFI11_20400 [Thalassococcus sp. S3]